MDNQLYVDDEYNAMDLTHTNKAILAKGSKIDFHSSSGGLTPGYLAKYKDGKTFSPRKIMIQNESRNMLLLSPNRKNVIVTYDTETGTPLRQLEAKNNVSDLDLPIDKLTAPQKFSNLLESPVVETVAISGNMVFSVGWDPREKGDELIVTDKAEIPSKKGTGFTCLATTSQGGVAVGSNTGEVRLYSSPSKGWKRAKTSLTQLADPITGIETSYDGNWIIWTTKEYLSLVKVSFEDDKGETHTGFQKSMGKHKPPSMIIKLSDEVMDRYGIKEVNFTPAKFDNAPYLGKSNIIEDNIVTSTGQWIIRWNFRKLKMDFEKHLSSGEIFTSVVPQVYKQAHAVVEKQFEYGENTIVAALTKDLSRLSVE